MLGKEIAEKTSKRKGTSDDEDEEDDEQFEEQKIDKAAQNVFAERLKELDKQLSQNQEDEDENIFLEHMRSKIQEDLVEDVNKITKNFSSKTVKGEDQKVSFMRISKENLTEGLTRTIDVIVSAHDLLKKIFEKNEDEHYLRRIIDIINTLTILEKQYCMLKEVLEFPGDDLLEIKANYASLGEKSIEIESKSQICIPILTEAEDFVLNRLLIEVTKLCTRLVIDEPEKKQSLLIFDDLKIVGSKLKTVVEIFPHLVIFPKNDLFALDKSSPVWKELSQHVYTKPLNPPKSIDKSFNRVLRSILLANAMVSNAEEKKSTIAKKLALALGAVMYFIRPKEASRKANSFFSEPRPKEAITVWNLPDSTIIKQVLKVILPRISYNRKIYIDSNYVEPITFDSVMKEDAENILNTISPKEFEKKPIKDIDAYIKNLFDDTNAATKVQIRILNHKKLIKKKSPSTKPSKSHQPHAHLKASQGPDDILDDVEGTFGGEKQLPKKKGLIESIINKFLDKKKKPAAPNDYECILIHIHGGGFISMSSRSHQTYSRKWANRLKIPVFSIDYPKAPENPYPAAINACWQAYCWILDHVEDVFNIKPKKVILVGDSAGGNLVASLTLKCIKTGRRIPDGVVLAYPALYLTTKTYTPSMLIALDDQILPHTFLKLCLSSYINHPHLKPEIDPMISPRVASNELLEKFPPCRILVGTKDPLHDDCWRFLKRLVDLNRDAKMLVYPNMPHGFLSYDAPAGMPEAKVCVFDAILYIKELLDLKDVDLEMEESQEK